MLLVNHAFARVTPAIPVIFVVGAIRVLQEFYQESPRQTKPKKGPKRKVHEFRRFS